MSASHAVSSSEIDLHLSPPRERVIQMMMMMMSLSMPCSGCLGRRSSSPTHTGLGYRGTVASASLSGCSDWRTPCLSPSSCFWITAAVWLLYCTYCVYCMYCMYCTYFVYFMTECIQLEEVWNEYFTNFRQNWRILLLFFYEMLILIVTPCNGFKSC